MIILCKMLHSNLKHKPLNHKQLGRGQSRAGNLEELGRKLSRRKPFLLIFRGPRIPFVNQARSTVGFQRTYFSALHGPVQHTAFNWDLDFHYDVWKDLITKSGSTKNSLGRRNMDQTERSCLHGNHGLEHAPGIWCLNSHHS